MEVKLFASITEAEAVLQENQPKLVKALGRNICVVRRNDQIIAFENECPHMGESLHQGNINYLGEIVCPLHSYRFNLKDGQPAQKSCGSLKFVSVVINEEVFLVL